MSKFVPLAEIATHFRSGMTVMVAGFLANGTAERIITALVESGVKDLTVIGNDTAYPDRGMGRLLNGRQVKKLIVSYIGQTPEAQRQLAEGTLEVEFVPQGTLIERMRAAGAGLGGVLTPTGLGTDIAKGKPVITVDGRDYLLEKPLRADMAIIGASVADRAGNLYYRGTSRNFNPVMATAADLVVATAQEVVPTGAIAPEDVHTPAMLVDLIALPEE